MFRFFTPFFSGNIRRNGDVFFPTIVDITMAVACTRLGLSILVLYTIFTVCFCKPDMPEETCETIPSEVHLVKEEYDELGHLQRTCSGDVAVNKCEGSCRSQVQPSVITPTGFLKECYCCRESFMRERIITLNHCYDIDGMKLVDEANSSLDVKLKEPAECKCYKCGDLGR